MIRAAWRGKTSPGITIVRHRRQWRENTLTSSNPFSRTAARSIKSTASKRRNGGEKIQRSPRLWPDDGVHTRVPQRHRFDSHRRADFQSARDVVGGLVATGDDGPGNGSVSADLRRIVCGGVHERDLRDNPGVGARAVSFSWTAIRG